jgi:hypothetical protein
MSETCEQLGEGERVPAPADVDLDCGDDTLVTDEGCWRCSD